MAPWVHISRNEATKFLTEVNKEQNGQSQRVYDSIFEGVRKESNAQVESLIKEAKDCREMISEFIYSGPETPFKKVGSNRFNAQANSIP